jgi:hypothetical protein
MAYIKIENHHHLLRDDSTNAIINTNNTEYENYISNYNRMKHEKEELTKLKNDVSSLHSDMHEIKSLLKLLIKENVDDN